MNYTEKQTSIMTTILAGHKDKNGIVVDWLDMDQLLERLPYKTTKESMQFSIRALIKKGAVKKAREIRRGRRRVVYVPTEEAFLDFQRETPQNSAELDEILEAL